MTRTAVLAGAHRPWRAAQLTAALREAGFIVTILADPGDAVARERPTLALWPGDAARDQPLHGPTVHGVDLPAPPGAGTSWCAAVASGCRGAGVALAASDAERGFWTAELRRAGVDVPVMTAPFAVPASAPASRPFDALTIVLDGVPGAAVLDGVAEAAAWAGRQNRLALRVLTVPGRSGLDSLLADRRLRAILPGVAVPAWQPGEPLPHGPLLDLECAKRIHVPDAVICARAQGLPVIVAATAAEACLTPSPGLAPAPDVAGRALLDAVEDALSRSAALVQRWKSSTPPQPLGPDAHVLVLSDEPGNMSDIRVHLPLGALHRRGAIGGYSVLRRDKLTYSTRPAEGRNDDARFDAIWVHRSHGLGAQLLLQVLGRPFVYDIDDNLLSAPSYRKPFSVRAVGAAQGLITDCAVLSCSTPRLARLLQRAAGVSLADKAVVTPNLLGRPPRARAAGLPRALVWASSDAPALTGARSAVVTAVVDFCLAHRLRVVCMGAPPPSAFTDAGLQAEHIGLLPYGEYLDYLGALSPGILVCPLETAADPPTQAFVDGKSDVKIGDAMMSGLVGVFSDAAPYRDSALPRPILCANTHAGWLNGLTQAYRACGTAADATPWPPERDAASAGLLPWAEALARAKLPAPLRLGEVRAALRYVAAQQTRFLTADEFDAGYYLDTHDDVRLAHDKGELASAYDHYLSSGHREGREAQALLDAQSVTAVWWGALLHTVDWLDASTMRRAEQMAQLQAERAARRALSRL